MSSRLSGAILALAAATLLAISLVGSAWWDGHPVSPTRTYTQIAHVGLHGAKLCLVDAADLETCKDAPTQSVFGPVGYAELVACGLLVISSLGLGILALRRSEDRKTFALLAIGGAVLADALAVGLILIGPTSEATIPYGTGLYLFFSGSTLAILGAILARRPTPALVLMPARPVFPAPVPMPPSQQQPTIDMAALMRDDPLRPSSPEPMLGGSRPAPPPSPGGSLPGPAGPLGAPSTNDSPLFQSAPQLRPLYEMPGNAPPVAPTPRFPPRAPTPLPRDKIAQQTGMATPLPYTPRTKPATGFPAPFSRQTPLPKSITEPPPIAPPTSRSVPASAPPPIARSKPESKPPISRTIPATVPPLASKPEQPHKPASPPVKSSVSSTLPGSAGGPIPLPPPSSDATDPSGFEVAREVGDSTDVNVPIEAPSPSADATSPNIQGISTKEEPALPRAETNSDELETIARDKISMSEIEQPKAPNIPMSTASESLPPPVENKRAQTSSSPSPACPQCEAPMAWVEEHLRFYCKSCRMYF